MFCLEVYMCTMCMLVMTEVGRRQWIPWDYSHRCLWTAWCGTENLIQSFANTADSHILQAISPATWLPSQRCKLESECVKTFSSSLPTQHGNRGLSHLKWLEQRWRAQPAWSQRKVGICCSFCDSGFMFFHSRQRCWVQLVFSQGNLYALQLNLDSGILSWCKQEWGHSSFISLEKDFAVVVFPGKSNEANMALSWSCWGIEKRGSNTTKTNLSLTSLAPLFASVQ